MIETIIFWFIALLTAGSAIFVVTSRNILHAAFSLCFTFLGVGAIYIFLQADFVAAVQLIVYVGGILVLIMFAVMFSSNVVEDTAEHGRSHLAMISGGTAAVALFASIVLLTQRLHDPLKAANKFDYVPYAHTVSMTASMQSKVPEGWKDLREFNQSDEYRELLKGFPSTLMPPADLVPESWVGSYTDPIYPLMKIKVFLFRFSSMKSAHDYSQVLTPLSLDRVGAKGVSFAYENDRVATAIYISDDGKSSPFMPHLNAWMRKGLQKMGDEHLTYETGLGHYLMGQYMLPFEVVSVLLLAALIGAVVIVRKELS